MNPILEAQDAKPPGYVKQTDQRRGVGRDEPHLAERVGSGIRIQGDAHGERTVGLLLDTANHQVR